MIEPDLYVVTPETTCREASAVAKQWREYLAALTIEHKQVLSKRNNAQEMCKDAEDGSEVEACRQIDAAEMTGYLEEIELELSTIREYAIHYQTLACELAKREGSARRVLDIQKRKPALI